MLRRLVALFAAVAAGILVVGVSGAAGKSGDHGRSGHKLGEIRHIVVIYEENHSFDNLYGGWEGVNGRANADAAHTLQKDQAGGTYACLKQNDVNLTSPPLSATCPSTTPTSHFVNAPFRIDDYLQPGDHTCPKALRAFSFPTGISKDATNPDGSFVGLPGGCTRDIVHKFYQEIYQLDGGRQDRYTTGSDAIGLTQGYYDTKNLPVYQYLHQHHHPHYAILDNFFQAAFGGSFLNHQFLIAASPPTWAGAPATQHALLDTNGFPATEPLYTPTSTVRDGAVAQPCAPDPAFRVGFVCGDWVVNTTQPTDRPHGSFGARIPRQTNPTIGDRLNGAGVDWAWYAGGWSNANGDVGAPGWTNGLAPDPKPAPLTDCLDPDADQGVTGATATPPNEHISQWPFCPNNLFQYHHQPFNYFEAFSRDTAAGLANRAAHLKDEQELVQLAQGSNRRCNLKPVSFVKPIGQENEHPGYASESGGSSHLVSLLRAIEDSKCAKDTMVVVTYDEFGGQWDHVSPPGQGNDNGPHDQWGPGTRIPALVIAPELKGRFVVDHTQYDTTSILATIEQRYGLPPVGTRDAAVNSLANVFDAHHAHGHHHHHDHHHHDH